MIVEAVAEEDANPDYSFIAMLVEVIHIAVPARKIHLGNRSSVLEVSAARVADLAGLARRSSIDKPLSEAAVAALHAQHTWESRQQR